VFEFDLKFEEKVALACDFIKEALGEAPSYVEIESDREEAELLLLDKRLDQFSFKEISDGDFTGKVAAVDGGSATVVKGRSFFIGIFRAGYVVFDKEKRVKQKVLPLSLETVSLGNVAERYKEAYTSVVGEEPTETPGLDKILDRLRIFEEWRLILELVEELNPSDILLVDGSLRASIVPPYSLLKAVTQKAKKKKIHLLGITKSSTLYWGKKAPLIPMVVKRAEELCENKRWYCRLSDSDLHLENPNWFGIIYVAKFKKSSEYAFRVDINREDQVPPDLIFSALSEYSSDPSVLGYPYPLTAAHNMVRIRSSEIEDIKYRLQQKALQNGISSVDWDLLFSDFHQVLNADLSTD
jgi:hypothetical protein